MEWLNLCGLLSRKPLDPPNQIAWGILGGTIGFLGSTGTLVVLKPHFAPLPAVILFVSYQFYLTYMLPPAPTQAKYLVLKSKRAKRYKGLKIPSGELTQLYMADELDFKIDVLEAMENSNEFCHWSVTFSQMWYNLSQLWPNANNFTLRNKANSKKEIADHYDRGNDFFRAFLGPRMKYTSGIFTHVDCTLEEAQDNKMATICRKLRLKKGMRMLDIGCGWGTLAGFAHQKVGAKAVGVTLSDEGAAWARSNNPGPEFIISDYRDCPEDEVCCYARTCAQVHKPPLSPAHVQIPCACTRVYTIINLIITLYRTPRRIPSSRRSRASRWRSTWDLPTFRSTWRRSIAC